LRLLQRVGLSSEAPALRRWQARTVVTVFVTYATYYFCRQNIAAALPAMQADPALAGLGKTGLGQITMALFLGYGFGQIFFGLLSDRFGARYLLLLGMLASAGLNVAFALSRPLMPMVIVWGLNGVFQASGMPACAKTIANWFTPAQRGRVQAIRGTDYPTGALLVTLLSGYLVQYYGWRWAFYAPAGILAVSAIHTFIRLRGSPEEVGLPPVEEHLTGAGADPARGRDRHDGSPNVPTAENGERPGPEAGGSEFGARNSQRERDEFAGWRYVLGKTLGSWRIWALALGFFGVTIARYGFGMWCIAYLADQGASIARAAVVSSVILVGGIGGILFAGTASDLPALGGRRAPVVVVQLFALAALTVLFPIVPVHTTWLLALYLMAIGFCTYGPDMMMCQTMAMDLASRKATATAGGFIDAFGSLGAALTVGLSGYLVDAVGWAPAMRLWAAGALMAALLVAPLWNYRAGRGRYH